MTRTVKHDKVSRLKDKKHPIAEDEWERILTEVLLDRQSDPDIELAAQVAEGQSITLIVRRSISGIKVTSTPTVKRDITVGANMVSATHWHH